QGQNFTVLGQPGGEKNNADEDKYRPDGAVNKHDKRHKIIPGDSAKRQLAIGEFLHLLTVIEYDGNSRGQQNRKEESLQKFSQYIFVNLLHYNLRLYCNVAIFFHAVKLPALICSRAVRTN